MKTFDIPQFYRSTLIAAIKEARKNKDPRKKDFNPTLLDFGPVRFYLARHFGFCYGVENAIEISYRALEENPGKKVYLLSQMIHNPEVNNDLISRGVSFIMDTSGNQLVPWEGLHTDDIVIIPAFGATLAIESKLQEIGIRPHQYDTTCPFVERVWKKSEKLGEDNYTIIIHGKYRHEETRATFSRAERDAPSIIIKNMDEAVILGKMILGEHPTSDFEKIFENRFSTGFDVSKDLDRVGVINQTTMLATETQAIAEYFKNIMIQKFGGENLVRHFADTRDTLCYATNENQESTYGLLKTSADMAFVVGGYNSSNTSHLYELCVEKLPTYYISSAREIISENLIRHYDFHKSMMMETHDYIPGKNPVEIIITSGASCPDTVIEEVLKKILSYFPSTKSPEEVVRELSVN
jgi:4-hydroxy-3-methylbut-2-enyl diphosphate reductase